ncbi:MAG: hypothetical protein K0R51_2707 [Cytophagaceae bacterium]|jgi:hypothetical protein|nr:hypothetical protein [Cytophagaceae bacterium]
MEVKYTQNFLNKLEDIFAESDYILRYEKGNFNSGYCLLKETKIAIINKYFPLEGKVNSLIEILKQITLDDAKMSDKNKKFYQEITAPLVAPSTPPTLPEEEQQQPEEEQPTS